MAEEREPVGRAPAVARRAADACDLPPTHPGWLLRVGAFVAAAVVGLIDTGSPWHTGSATWALAGARDAPLGRPSTSGPNDRRTAAVEALRKEEIDTAKQLAKDFPDSAAAMALLGAIHSRLGNSAEALRHWERSLELDPQRADAHNNVGWVALKKEEYEKAAARFRKALAIDPTLAGAHHRLASALIFLGRWKEAIAPLKRALELSPKAAGSHYLLGLAQRQLQDYAQAKKSYEAAVAIQPDHKNACYGLAMVCARLGEVEKAKEYRERFQKIEGRDLRELINENEAFDDLAAARRRLALTHTGAGQLCRQHERLTEAERHWKRAAALDPRNVACRSGLAALYQMTAHEREALALCEEIRALQPDNASNWRNIGVLHARLKQSAAADKAFRKAIGLAPRDPLARGSLALLLLLRRRQLAEAKTLAQTAATLRPSVPNYMLLGKICRARGDRAGEIAAAKRLVELAPDNPRFRQMLRTLEGGR